MPDLPYVFAPAKLINDAFDFKVHLKVHASVSEATAEFTKEMGWTPADTEKLLKGETIVDEALATRISNALGGKPSVAQLMKVEETYRAGVAAGKMVVLTRADIPRLVVRPED